MILTKAQATTYIKLALAFRKTMQIKFKITVIQNLNEWN